MEDERKPLYVKILVGAVAFWVVAIVAILIMLHQESEPACERLCAAWCERIEGEQSAMRTSHLGQCFARCETFSPTKASLRKTLVRNCREDCIRAAQVARNDQGELAKKADACLCDCSSSNGSMGKQAKPGKRSGPSH